MTTGCQVMKSFRALAGATVLWLLWSGQATGETRPPATRVILKYQSTGGCLDAAEFKASVVSRVGYDPFADGGTAAAVVHIRPGPGEAAGHIAWFDAAGQPLGQQSFPSTNRDCLELSRAVAFALALQIELFTVKSAPARLGAAPTRTGVAPMRTAAAPIRTGAAPEAATAASAPESEAPGGGGGPRELTPVEQRAPVAEANAAATSAASERLGPPLPPPPPPPPPPGLREKGVLAAGVGASVGLGMSRAPTGLGRAFGTLGWQRFAVELSGEVSLLSTMRRGDGAGVSQRTAFAGLAACALHAPWQGCLVVKGGGARLAGEQIERSSSAWVWSAATGARAAFTKPLGSRFFASVRAEGVVFLYRWTASLDDMPVFTTHRWAGVLGLDAGVVFP